ncbi:MAG: hypothetical protein ACRDO7_01435 [Nocardioidaceae bacterium]
MAFRTRARTVLAATLLPAAIVTGCSGDDDKTLPAIDQSSSPGVDDPSESAGRPSRTDRSGGSIAAAAPQGATLAPDEQAAYEKAVTDHTDWVKTALRMRADPMVNTAVENAVHEWALDPYASEFLDELRQFEANGIAVRGRAEVYWRVPVRVNLDARWPVITWKECDGDGTIQVTKDGEPVEQTDPTPYASRLTLRADSTGRWRPTISKDLGPCGA